MSDAPGSRPLPPAAARGLTTVPVSQAPPGPRGVRLPPPEARVAAAFSVELVLAILQAAGSIDEAVRRETLAKEHALRGRLLKERGGGKVGGPRYVVSPIELVASLALK